MMVIVMVLMAMVMMAIIPKPLCLVIFNLSGHTGESLIIYSLYKILSYKRSTWSLCILCVFSS